MGMTTLHVDVEGALVCAAVQLHRGGSDDDDDDSPETI